MLKKSIVLVVFMAIFWLFSMSQADVDLWGHLKFGLDMVDARQVIKVDPYSFLTEGQEWINHEWLSEVSFALAWLAADSLGLVILKILVGFLIVGILLFHLVRAGRDVFFSALLILLASFLIEADLITVRPQIFTVLFFSLTLFAVVQAERKQYRWLWILPIVFTFWVNFHGGFLAGWGILFAWAFVHLLTNHSSWKTILPPVFLTVLATLVNPYGLRLIVFLLQTATIPRLEIYEWTPITVFEPLGWLYIGFILLSGLAFFSSERRKTWPEFALFGIIVLLPLVARRHLSLFAVGVVLLAGEDLVDFAQKLTFRERKKPLPAWLAVFPVVIALLLGLLALQRVGQIPILPQPPFPLQAVEVMQKSGASGNLAIEFSWGEYAIWHLSDQVKVSVDGRRETVYSPEIYQQNVNFLFGMGDWDELLRIHPVEMVLISKLTPTYNLMKFLSEWTIVYEDDASVLFALKGSTQEQLLRSTASETKTSGTDLFFP